MYIILTLHYTYTKQKIAGLCWLVFVCFFCQLHTSSNYLGSQTSIDKNATSKLTCRPICRTFTWLTTNVGKLSLLWQLGLDCLRQQVDLAMRSKAVSGVPPWLLHALLHPGPCLDFPSWWTVIRAFVGIETLPSSYFRSWPLSQQ